MDDVDLENQPFNTECPQCGAAIEVTPGQVVAEETVVCPSCLAEVALKDKRGAVSRAEAAVATALDKLQEAIEDAGTAT
jgi:hypothetical protein